MKRTTFSAVRTWLRHRAALAQRSLQVESRYAAFISYRHIEPDQTISRSLHELIETYRPPAAKGIKPPAAAPLRVFLDTEETVAGDLPEQVTKALHAARFLIVVCSPRVRDEKKPWVEHEVSEFIRARPDNVDRILPLLIEGTPDTSYPLALLERTSSSLRVDSDLRIVTRLGANIVGANGRASLKLLDREKLRLLAPILGIPYALLADREADRRKRRRTRQLVAVVVLCAVITVLFPPRVTSVVTEEELSAGKWITNLRGDAALLLVETGETTLWQAERGWAGNQRLPGTYITATISDDGKWIAALSRNKEIVVVHAEPSLPLASTSVLRIPDRKSDEASARNDDFASISADGEWIVATLDGKVHLWRPRSQPDVTAPYFYPGGLPADTRLVARLTSTGQHVIISEHPKGKVYVGRTSDPKVPPVRLATDAISAVELSRSGGLLAYAASDEDVSICRLGSGIAPNCELQKVPRRTKVGAQVGPNAYPELEISPDDQWVLAKRMAGAVFVTGPLKEPSSFQRTVPGGAGKDGLVSTRMRICESSKWAATLARDSELFVWQLGSTAGGPSLPAGRGTALMQFSPDCARIVASDKQGTVYVFKVGEKPELSRPSSIGAPFGSLFQMWGTFRWAEDSQSVYAFDQNQVLWGVVGDHLELVTTVKSEIHDLVLSGDRNELLILANGRVLRVGRALRIWGVPVSRPTWPNMKRLRGSLHGFDSSSGTGAGKFEDPD